MLKNESVDIVIDATGCVRMIYDESIDAIAIGRLEISRASHVEPTGEGHWTADLCPVGGPMLGPYHNRSDALRAEVAWLRQHWLIAGPTESTNVFQNQNIIRMQVDPSTTKEE